MLGFIASILIKGNIVTVVVYQCVELTISTKSLLSPTRSEGSRSVSNPILEYNSHFLKCVISANNTSRKTALRKTISAGRFFSKLSVLNLPTNDLNVGLAKSDRSALKIISEVRIVVSVRIRYMARVLEA